MPCSWTGRLNIVQTSFLSNLIYRFSAISIKNAAGYFTNTKKLILKFIYEETEDSEETHNTKREEQI